ALYGDEFDLKGVADQHAIKECLGLGMIVAIDKSGNNTHSLCIEDRCAAARQVSHVLAAADGLKPTAPNGECLSTGKPWVHGVDIGVNDHQVGRTTRQQVALCGCAAVAPCRGICRRANSGKTEKSPPIESLSSHCCTVCWRLRAILITIP